MNIERISFGRTNLLDINFINYLFRLYNVSIKRN